MIFLFADCCYLVVVPMFIFMGSVASSTGVVSDLYDLMNRWLSRFRGSLLMVSTAASAVYGAVSGSTVVNATVFTRIGTLVSLMLALAFSEVIVELRTIRNAVHRETVAI